MCCMPRAVLLRASAKPICSGTAGVKGPAQNVTMATHAVHHQGLTMSAIAAHTTSGDQNMPSASSSHGALCQHHRSALRTRSRITFYNVLCGGAGVRRLAVGVVCVTLCLLGRALGSVSG